VRIGSDAARFEGPLVFAAVMNTRTYAGGMRFAPEAEIDDGLLDLCAVADRGLLGNARSLVQGIRGRHRGAPGVTLARGASVRIEADAPLPIALDGDLTELRTPCDVIALPGALRVLGAPR
jgi:diacylglycerol kinase family enzyme